MTVGCQNIFLVDKTIEPSCAMKWVSIPAPELTKKQFIIKQRNGQVFVETWKLNRGCYSITNNNITWEKRGDED